MHFLFRLIRNKQTLYCHFTLEYTIRKFQASQEGMEFSNTHKTLAYADDVNLLHEDIAKCCKAEEKSSFRR